MRKFFVFLAVFCVTAAMITGCSREQGTEGQQSGADKGQSEVSSGDDSGISDERKIVFQADMVFAVKFRRMKVFFEEADLEELIKTDAKTC